MDSCEHMNHRVHLVLLFINYCIIFHIDNCKPCLCQNLESAGEVINLLKSHDRLLWKLIP